MARQDLISAIRNALERGESIEKAKQALINAGYNRTEIEEAARVLGIQSSSNAPSTISGVYQARKPYNTLASKNAEQATYSPAEEESQVHQQFQPSSATNPVKNNLGALILLIGLLIILGAIIIGIVFFRQQIIDIITKLTG